MKAVLAEFVVDDGVDTQSLSDALLDTLDEWCDSSFHERGCVCEWGSVHTISLKDDEYIKWQVVDLDDE